MNLMIMYEITYLNAMKCCTNVLKNIYMIQVYQYLREYDHLKAKGVAPALVRDLMGIQDL